MINNIRLYCLARTDMNSMCPGRMAAQVSHASTKMMHDIQESDSLLGKMYLKNWLNEAGGFGTAIILRPLSKFNQETEIRNLVHLAKKCPDLFSDLLIDPEYYVADGDVFHRLENVLTCSYFFGEVERVKTILGNNNLY